MYDSVLNNNPSRVFVTFCGVVGRYTRVCCMDMDMDNSNVEKGKVNSGVGQYIMHCSGW